MNLRFIFSALGLAAVATLAQANDVTPAQAESAKPQTPAPAATAAPDANRKICRQERPMGSLIPARVCKTAAQWEEEREQSRKMLQDMQQRTGSTATR